MNLLSKLAKQKLAEIETACHKQGINLTAKRRLVLQLMLAHNKMISAYDLLDELRQVDPQAKPPTIYRALAFLLQYGFIHKVESNNSYIICPHFGHVKHLSILLICDSCHMIIEEESDEIDILLTQKAEQHGFKIQHRLIEVKGECQQCQAKKEG